MMTGGEINVKGMSLPGADAGGIGALALWGGTINVGTARGGLVMYPGGQIDITEGLLVLEGDQEALVEGFVDEDFMVAYGGAGTVQFEYDGDFTYVIGVQNLPCDFDGNLICEIKFGYFQHQNNHQQ